MVVMATTLTRLSASYKTIDLPRQIGYTHYFTGKKKKSLFLQLLYPASQRRDATLPSESNNALQ